MRFVNVRHTDEEIEALEAKILGLSLEPTIEEEIEALEAEILELSLDMDEASVAELNGLRAEIAEKTLRLEELRSQC